MRNISQTTIVYIAGAVAALILVVVFFVASCSGQGSGSVDNPQRIEGAGSQEEAQAETRQRPDTKDYQGLIESVKSASSEKALKTFSTLYPVHSAPFLELNAKVKNITERYDLSFVMVDLTTGEGISFNPDAEIYSASSIKGPYVASIGKYAPETAESYASTIEGVIEVSDNDGYDDLRHSLGSQTFGPFVDEAQVESFPAAFFYPTTGAREFAKLWVETYDYLYVDTNEKSEWLRSLYGDTLNSYIHQGIGEKYTVNSKAGWFSGEYNVLNDSGIVFAEVNGESRPYVISVFSSAADENDLMADLVQSIDAVHTDLVSRQQ